MNRFELSTGIAVLLAGVLGAGAAQATVKCQCNNGSVVQATGVDYDDEDLDAACNDACSMLGGGRVWNVDTDRDEDDDDDSRRIEPPRPRQENP
jgi:hypothetical protein